MFLLCIFLFFQSVYPYEVTTQYSNGDQSVIFDLPKNTTATVNDTKSSENKTRFTMERITQPSQTEQIERTLESLSFSDLNSSLSVKAKKGGLDNFKPSPQIETYYEFNKFPVEPALPEAKTFGNVHEDENTFNSWTEKPVASQLINKQNFPTSWVENPREHNSWFKKHTITGNPWVDKTTTEQAWVSRIKFPQSSYASVNERPYKFITNNAKLPTYAAVSFPVTTEGFSFNKPVETSNKNSKPTEGFWEKLMGYGVNKNGSPKPAQKTSLDYNLLEKPPHLIPHKEYQHGVSNEANPWKKITKLLTAVIPIGLLISALTPTVITVTSLNDTQSRYRAEDSRHQEIASPLASSYYGNLYHNKLNGNDCEDRVLCELLVSASISKNSEEHIDNLLHAFSEHEDIQDKRNDLIKIFEAVKNEDCSSILCGNTNM